ncbi:MAG: NAD(P)-dependent alcohol dehydrogenase [Hyphomonadaceae bacterium]
MRITAAVARAPDVDFTIETVEIDEPRPDEVLVRIVGVGLCHTDLVTKAGFAPFSLPAVLGHEGAGIVERVGADVTKVAPGDRVAISFRSCGKCPRCGGGEPAYCAEFGMLNFGGARPDGSKAIRAEGEAIASNFFGQSSFGSYALTYERNLVKAPANAPLELLGPLGCGVQTGAGGVMNALACRAGSSILISGGGAVGLSAVMGAVVRGCKTIIVLEPHASRRALALELGATHALAPAETPDLAAAVNAITPGGVDYGFDTTGVSAVQQEAMKCLAARGVFGFVGISPPGTPPPGDIMQIIGMGQTIKGIVEGDSNPDVFIPELIKLYQAGRFPIDKLVRTYPLSQINQAIADQHHGECVKVVLLPDG